MTIGVVGTAKGGHTWTFRTVHEALSQHHDVIVVELSARNTPELGDLPGPNYHIKMDFLRPWRTVRALEDIVKAEHPEILHSFDARIDYYTSRVSNRCQIPLVLTKCGGPTNRPETFVADAVIVFNDLDIKLLSKGHGTGPRQAILVPNRVRPFECDSDKIKELKSRINPNSKIILRISRINETYKDTFLQGINLVRKLNADGVSSTFVLVGFVEDKAVLEEMEALGGDQILVVTDPAFTDNAKVLIDLCDLNIGTGRSLMEAASKGRVLLTLQSGSDLPVLVTQENFASLLATNFSPRNKAKDFEAAQNYDNIVAVCTDPELMADHQQQAQDFYQRYFDVTHVPAQYETVYAQVTHSTKPILRHLSIQLRKLHQAHGDAQRFKAA